MSVWCDALAHATGACSLVLVAGCSIGPVKLPAQSPNAILQFTNTDLLDAQRSALLQVAPGPRVDSFGTTLVTVCVSVRRGGQEFAADPGTLAVLDLPGRRAVIPRDCPRTYVMALYSTERAPPGWIDPYYIKVARVTAQDTTTLTIVVDITQDIRTKSYRCETSRSGSSWKSNCRHDGSRVEP